MRAYSYIRFSSLRQADGDSLRRQMALARAYAEENGFELDERFTYKDLGVSAYDRSNLEKGALSLFLKAIQEGKVPKGSVLLVEAFDRLTRSPPLVAVNLLSDIVRAGITIITLRDKKTYTEESLNASLADLMMSVVLLMAAHEEVKHRAGRVREYYKNRRDNHMPVVGATAPGWLRKLPSEEGWELIPDKAESVQKVFQLAVTGLGGVAITRRANAEDWPVPSRMQKGWHHTNVLKLLKNRVVLGEYQPMTIVDGKLIPLGEPWPDFFPKAIDEDLFLRVQAVKSRRKFATGKRDVMYRNLFHGLLRCGCCGATLTLHKTRTSTDVKYMYFTCVDRQRNKSTCTSFRAKDTFIKLLPSLLGHVLDAVLIKNSVSELREKYETEQVRLKDAKNTQQRLLGLLEAGPNSGSSGSASLDKQLYSRLKDVSSEVDRLEEVCLDLDARLKDSTSVLFEEDIDKTIIEALKAVLDPEKVTERANLHDKLSRVIEHIWLYPGIAAVKRVEDNLLRWIPLEPESASLIMSPPDIPPIRKHHKNRQEL